MGRQGASRRSVYRANPDRGTVEKYKELSRRDRDRLQGACGTRSRRGPSLSTGQQDHLRRGAARRNGRAVQRTHGYHHLWPDLLAEAAGRQRTHGRPFRGGPEVCGLRRDHHRGEGRPPRLAVDRRRQGGDQGCPVIYGGRGSAGRPLEI